MMLVHIEADDVVPIDVVRCPPVGTAGVAGKGGATR